MRISGKRGPARRQPYSRRVHLTLPFPSLRSVPHTHTPPANTAPSQTSPACPAPRHPAPARPAAPTARRGPSAPAATDSAEHRPPPRRSPPPPAGRPLPRAASRRRVPARPRAPARPGTGRTHSPPPLHRAHRAPGGAKPPARCPPRTFSAACGRCPWRRASALNTFVHRSAESHVLSALPPRSPAERARVPEPQPGGAGEGPWGAPPPPLPCPGGWGGG